MELKHYFLLALVVDSSVVVVVVVVVVDASVVKTADVLTVATSPEGEDSVDDSPLPASPPPPVISSITSIKPCTKKKIIIIRFCFKQTKFLKEIVQTTRALYKQNW